MNKLFFAIFSGILCVSIISGCETRKKSGTTGGLSWKVSGKTLIISGKGEMPDYDCISPSRPWDHLYNPLFKLGSNPFTFYYYPTKITAIVINEGITSIGDNFFYSLGHPTSVTIPSSVTSIKNKAFSNGGRIKSFYVAENNTVFSSENGILFNKAKTVLICYPAMKTDVDYTLPGSITHIGDGAFEGSKNLTSVIIPNSVTYIGKESFYGCKLASVTIPESVTYIGNGAFTFCENLTSVTIPNSVTSIEDQTFYSCKSLTSITIPNSVTSIGFRAFYSCESLKSITIPNSVVSIESRAFMDCRGLTEIVNYATMPQTIGADVFQYVDKTNCTLWVPASSMYAYYVAEIWKNFGEIKTVNE
jgi:hypothetical protein